MTIVAKFAIDYIQYLDENHQMTQALPKFANNATTITELYHLMVLTRLFDEKAIALQRTGKLGTYPASRGQEAVFVAIGHALKKTDVFVPYYRDHGTLLQRGMTMKDIFAYWGGDERGSNFDPSSEDLPICIPIATQYCHAAGIAKAIKIRRQSRAVLVSIGDGGTSKGDFYEAMNVAGVWRLPIVFVVNNNQWAISMPTKEQTAVKTFAQKAIAAGFTGIQVDGNDVIAMRETVDQALIQARAGQGPTLIEAITYRHCDHTTADDATRYQPRGEAEKEWSKEPIARVKNYLLTNNLWSAQQEQQLQQTCKNEIEQAVQDYLQQSPQSVTSLFDYLYATLPKAYQWQQQTVLHYAQEVKS